VKRFVFALAALAGAAALTAAAGSAADNDSNFLPNPTLTPGATSKVSVEKLCSPDYTAAPLSKSKTEQALSNYGMAGNPADHVVDWLIPASLGGSDELDNLWPQAPKGEWGADKKNELEAKLHDLVCSKQLKLADAQKAIRKDWVKAYRQYVTGSVAAQQ